MFLVMLLLMLLLLLLVLLLLLIDVLLLVLHWKHREAARAVSMGERKPKAPSFKLLLGSQKTLVLLLLLPGTAAKGRRRSP